MNPKALLVALRPHQWVKNTFVFAALVFAAGERGGHGFAQDDIVRTIFAFLGFCLGSSAVYLVNDLFDVESDRKHPTKRLRPIASGALPASVAWYAAIACAFGAILLSRLAGDHDRPVFWVVAAYMTLNLAYSLRLKHVVLVDAFCIAGGFLLRVFGGGLAAGAHVSHWLMLCTLFLSLFLALCKRRASPTSWARAAGSTAPSCSSTTPASSTRWSRSSPRARSSPTRCTPCPRTPRASSGRATA
jgi:4-hydroxybenzoate polyprenyltransferase